MLYVFLKMENHLTRLNVLIIKKGGVKMINALLLQSITGNEVVQAISTVGFPIVMCGCLMYYINSTLENVRKTMTELNSAILELKGVLENDKE